MEIVLFLLPLPHSKSMEKIVVNVSWCDKNFGASLSENVPGAVVITAKSYDELVDEVRETLKVHVEGMIADGDNIPQWLREGDYEFEYHLDASALLKNTFVVIENTPRVI